MSISLRRENLAEGQVLVHVTGELDLAARDLVDRGMHDVLRGVPALIIVNLSGTRFLDAGGIGALIHAYTLAQRAGAEFTVTGYRGMVEQVLRVTRAYEVLCQPSIATGGLAAE